MDRLERILAIMGIVTRGDIETLRANMRRNNLLIPKAFLILTLVILQALTELCSLGEPDRQALTDFV